MTKDDYIARAPTTIGDGPEAVAIVKEVARGLFPLVAAPHRATAGFLLMRDEWSPRCQPPWDADRLHEIITEAESDFVADKAAAEPKRIAAAVAAERQARTRTAAERAAAANLKARESVVNLAKHLGLSERYTHTILTEGTTSRERAEQIAGFRGGNPEHYLRKPRRRGRRRELVAWFMKAGVDDFPFRQFVHDAYRPEHCGSAAAWFIRALMDIYAAGRAPDDIEDLESLLHVAHEENLAPDIRDAAHSVWQEFKVWRIKRVAELAVYEVEDA